MNTTIFSQRLQECRKRKFSSQQAFADAYMEKYGMIRQKKKETDNNMFGTVQAWEQGKSTPTAEVLSNICELLDCDADYLLGRINQKTHDLTTAHQYTGLSVAALEQLHEYRMNLISEPNWTETLELEENWTSHKYYIAYALYLIDELLTGSESHKLSVGILDCLLVKIYEEGIGARKEDYEHDNDGAYSLTNEEIEQLVKDTRNEINHLINCITSNIHDILYENAVNEQLPEALKISTSGNKYFFSIYE